MSNLDNSFQIDASREQRGRPSQSERHTYLDPQGLCCSLVCTCLSDGNMKSGLLHTCGGDESQGLGCEFQTSPNTASSLQLLLVRRWEQNSGNCLLKPTQALAQCELGQTPVGRIHKQSCHPFPALPQERRLPQRDRIRSLHDCVIVGTWKLVK